MSLVLHRRRFRLKPDHVPDALRVRPAAADAGNETAPALPRARHASIGSARQRAIAKLSRLGLPFTLHAPHHAHSAAGRAMRTIAAQARALLPDPLVRWPASRTHAGLLRQGARLAMTLLWPVFAWREMRVQMRNWADADHRDRPADWQSWLRRFADGYGLALTLNIPPLEYRIYQLHRPERRAWIDEYLYQTDTSVRDLLNQRRAQHIDCSINEQSVHDKLHFAARCVQQGLPCVPSLATFSPQLSRADLEHAEQAIYQIHSDVWIKPIHGRGGSGSEPLRFEEGVFFDPQNRAWTPQQLIEKLRRGAWIVQPRLHNHPDIAACTNGALASLRVVTGIFRNHHTQSLFSMLYLPYGHKSNSVAGIACIMDESSGTIIRACRLNHTDTNLSHHPDTGAALIGVCIPHWIQVHALAQRAHASAFPEFATLGWDIALTPSGPALLEANVHWIAMHTQTVHDRPIGQTAFAQLIADYL